MKFSKTRRLHIWYWNYKMFRKRQAKMKFRASLRDRLIYRADLGYSSVIHWREEFWVCVCDWGMTIIHHSGSWLYIIIITEQPAYAYRPVDALAPRTSSVDLPMQWADFKSRVRLLFSLTGRYQCVSKVSCCSYTCIVCVRVHFRLYGGRKNI